MASPRPSTTPLVIRRKFSGLTMDGKVCVVWDELDERVRRLSDLRDLDGEAGVIEVTDLLLMVEEEVKSDLFDRFNQVMLTALRDSAAEFLDEEKNKFPDKLLVAAMLAPAQPTKMREVTPILARHDVPTNNATLTLKKLDEAKLIELKEEKGKENEFVITGAGYEKLKQLLKR